ncbi:MAG: alpha-D-ribose 1-methylphosphonate 5-triphosphate diphosphatase [Bacteroidota bacterium]|nr:alpha-D-ribose 1-methylphosphonate 5-triphosphate diphosphatase [uncultured Allomuricauda sp.]
MVQTITNARIVTPTEDFIGTLQIEDECITDISKTSKIYNDAINLNQQWLTPGCIDIHSDYIEKELHPRPSANFPMPFAFHFMDQRAAACGITTLFSAISFSSNEHARRSYEGALSLSKSLDELSESGSIRHYIHSRLDPNSEQVVDYLDAMKEIKSLKIVVVNESIPGQRQFRLEEVIEKRAKILGITVDEYREKVTKEIEEKSKIDKRKEIQEAFEESIPLGSHDDTTVKHVEEGKLYGSSLSEMPTTIEAARKAKELDMWVCMGAPNYYRGGSHCGNLSCADAMKEDLVDMLCSDYHFPTMLSAVIRMINDGISPSKAINYVSLNPAKFLKMDQDLGSIDLGKKADLVAFNSDKGFAQVSHMWVNGRLKFTSSTDSINTSNNITIKKQKEEVQI